MIAEELQIIIDAKVTAAVNDLKKVQAQTTKTENSAKKMAKAFVKQGLAIGAAAVSIGTLVKGVKAATAAFAIQEQAETSLRAAISATGKEAEISVDELGDYASALQELTLYGDEAILSGQALLQSLADLNQDGLEQITPAVLDFATGMGVDLQTAMSLVGKTLGSSTNALSRYGIEIDASASKAEKLEQLTAALESKFGGMAEAAAETASGGVVQLKNAFGDLLEEQGEWALKSAQPTINWLTDIVTEFKNAKEAANDYRDAIKAQEEGVETADQTLLLLEHERDRLKKIIDGHRGVGVATKQAYAEAVAAVKSYETAMARAQGMQAQGVAWTEEQVRAEEARVEAERIAAEESARLAEESARLAEERAAAAVKAEEERLAVEKAAAEERERLIQQEMDAYLQNFQNRTDLETQKQEVLAELHQLEVERQEDIREELEQTQAAYEQMAEAVILSAGSMFEAFGAALAAGESFNDAAKEFAKSAAVTVLRTLGEKAAAEAAVLWAKTQIPVTGSTYIPSAVAMTAASAGAFASAGAVSAFANGGDFMTNGPQLIMVGDNAGGRERVRIDPQPDSRSSSGGVVIQTGDIYGAGGKDEFIEEVMYGIKKAQRERVA